MPLHANRSMPPGTVIPVLAYPDVPFAAEWLCGAFGFRERLRIGAHRVQLLAGDASLVVAEGAPPISQQGTCDSVMIRVADVDAHAARAAAAGARIVRPPADHPYGERQYTAEDFVGHAWTFSQTIADVDPAAWGGVPVP